MTLGQAKKIVRFLLDDQLFCDYEDKIAAYFDMGQKRIAATTDLIEQTVTVESETPQEIDLTERIGRFYKLRRVEGGAWKRLSPTRIRLETGTYRLFCALFPHDITAHTTDDYRFEISEAAQTALPYYVAAQVSTAEHDLRYYQIYQDEFAGILENVHEANGIGRLAVHPFKGVTV